MRRILSRVAAEPPALTDDLKAAIARARDELAESGELQRPGGADFEPPIPKEAGEVILELMRDGTYAAAVARVMADDPELADQ